MAEFAQSVAKFLDFNEYRVLTDKGSISKQQALLTSEMPDWKRWKEKLDRHK